MRIKIIVFKSSVFEGWLFETCFGATLSLLTPEAFDGLFYSVSLQSVAMSFVCVLYYHTTGKY